MDTSITSVISPSSGDLVRVTDDSGLDIGIAIYISTVIPRDEGMDEFDLMEDQNWIESDIFHIIPHLPHYRVIMGGRTLHLSTRGYTLLPIGDKECVNPVQTS
jgi:hypothetical protein